MKFTSILKVCRDSKILKILHVVFVYHTYFTVLRCLVTFAKVTQIKLEVLNSKILQRL